MYQPGLIALLGSGETAAVGGQVFEALAARLPAPLTVAVLETPAGFELNASRVAGRVAEFLSVRLQNYRPAVRLIPARRRGTPASPDESAALQDLPGAEMIFMGPGSPTYAVRQLAHSLAWDMLQALHRQGAALALASAATIAVGRLALPVYEIYKAGEDPRWKPGLDLFGPYGLSLVFIPHWNNSDGGSELDTSHCFMGRERFELLSAQLSPGIRVVGLDEHTGLIIDFQAQECRVLGCGEIHLVAEGREQTFQDGQVFALSRLGDYRPLADECAGISAPAWQQVSAERTRRRQPVETPVPPEVEALLAQRQAARRARNWPEADALRAQILALGWQVLDTPQGMAVERIKT